MGSGMVRRVAPFILAAAASTVLAAGKDLGNGFRDLGVAAPISNHRGMVAAHDADGRNVLLVLLMDHRGGYAVLMLDTATGKSQEIPMPFNSDGDSPYSSLLSSQNKFYTHFGNYFVEFDPAKREFTFSHKTAPQMAMGMTEDDQGVIWSVTYPQSGVVSFNPKTREFRDYGHVYKQSWQQYDRSVATDDTGFLYFAVGNTASQIIGLDPKTGKATPFLKDSERKQGSATLYRDTDGKVYAQALGGKEEPWFQLYKGEMKRIDGKPPMHPKKIITGSQALSDTTFPDGTRATQVNLVDRKLVVREKNGQTKEFKFDYQSEGAIIMDCATAPDGTIFGGTTFPMRAYIYDPKSDEITNRAAYGQWNAVTTQGKHIYAGAYGGGNLLDWDTTKPWVPTEKGKQTNPNLLLTATPDVHRPTQVLALEDGNRVILAGTPDYGFTGGGLAFWDRQTGKHEIIGHQQIVPDQATQSMVELPDNKMLAGTTTAPGTGGEKKAHLAELYLMDLASKHVEWHEAVLPGVQEYTQMVNAPKGLVYGIADQHLFFVFDPAKKALVYQKDLDPTLGKSAYQQGPRVFVQAGDGGKMYMLFHKGIAEIDPANFAVKLVTKSPVDVESGGAWLAGKLYFVSGSHVYSWDAAK